MRVIDGTWLGRESSVLPAQIRLWLPVAIGQPLQGFGQKPCCETLGGWGLAFPPACTAAAKTDVHPQLHGYNREREVSGPGRFIVSHREKTRWRPRLAEGAAKVPRGSAPR